MLQPTAETNPTKIVSIHTRINLTWSIDNVKFDNNLFSIYLQNHLALHFSIALLRCV